MKKYVFTALLSLIAIFGLASEKLTLKLAPGGPEHGTLRAYHIIGTDEVRQHYQISDSIVGDTIVNQEMTIEKRHYLGKIFVVGEGFDYDRIIAAYKGANSEQPGQPVKEEAGFSHWGFIKKYQIKTSIIAYSRLSQSPPIVSVTEKFIYGQKNNFHFGSIVALIFLLSLGAEIGAIIFNFKPWYKMKWSAIKDSNSYLVGEIGWMFTVIYCLNWSYNVGKPFVYLAGAAILIGFIITASQIIRLAKNTKKNKPKSATA